MVSEVDERPDPTALLRQVEADERRSQRGKLKIFFGSAAGVGKTYAMLQAAQRRRQEGVDVLVGIVETHKRGETESLLGDLPILPRRIVDHRGVRVEEFDLDTALKRKPSLILIDELAHTNVPCCRHPKRWQDVEELLSAGLDVFTTLNVQHLESLNDVVESITGIGVRETVPDLLFDEADDIVFVDATPDELLKRLREGKIYVAPGANERALQNFFRKTNLLSLRELALRRTADYVDAGTDDERLREGLTTQNVAGDRLMVCLGPDRLAAKLVRTARRLATSMKAPWTAVYVETGREDVRDRKLREHIQNVMQIAERNGARLVTLQGPRIADELLAYARLNGITKIIIGKPLRSPWREALRPNLVNAVIRQSRDIDVHVITGPTEPFSKRRLPDLHTPRLTRGHARALVFLAALTGAGWLFHEYLPVSSMAMIYLLGVVLVAAWLGRGPAFFAAAVSVMAFAFFFSDVPLSLDFWNHAQSVTLGIMAIISLVLADQTSRLRDQTRLSRKRERRTQIFYQLTRALAAVRGRKAVCAMVVKHTEETFGATAAIWLPDAQGTLALFTGKSLGDPEKEAVAARWCFANAQPAGLGTDTLPSAAGHYLPIKGTEKARGVFALFGASPNEAFSPDEIEKLETIASLLASALERTLIAEAAEQNKVAVERDRLRNLLLTSVSDDLHTPLAAIADAADALTAHPELAREETALTRVHAIRLETGRLTRLVRNLLDVTRYEGGGVPLNAQRHALPEIVGNALASCHDLLKHHKVETRFAADLPLVAMDGALISQVLTNLFENAAKHTPVGTNIVLEARSTEEGVLMTIDDNGFGIPAGKEKIIFEKFAAFPRGDEAKGVGLGLAICQAIVLAHHGRIWAENRPEGGSRFCLLLPS